MPVTTTKTIYTGNAHLVRQAITRYDPDVDAYRPYVGGTFTVSFATSPDGTGPIAGLQNIPLDETLGAPGTYFTIIASAALAPLVPLVGTVVYQIVVGGALNGLDAVTPLRVQATRWAQ